ncbi:MAG TPA: glycoside hydrolase family protein [Chitinophagaceae bacterium]|nr:glycoside hydrolase family protein [Chitinophagaceae bacterium]
MRLVIFLLSFTFLQNLHAQDDLDLGKRITTVDSSNLFLSDSYYIWGASVVKGDDGKYHMFYSRWQHADKPLDDDSMNYIFNGFAGWQKYSEIAHAVADHIMGPYKYVNVVLKGSQRDGDWKRFFMHNPMITKFNGRYYLYYISNSFDSSYTFDKPTTPQNKRWFQYNCTQKIGVAIADKIEDFSTGKFELPEQYIMEPDGVNTMEITNNPTVAQGADGKFYMMFKSRMTPRGHMTMWMAKADQPQGPFKLAGNVFSDPDYAAEDAFMWYDKKRKRFYAVLKNFSNSGKLNEQFGSVALITSPDGLKWKPAAHPMVTPRQITWKDGRVIELAHLERPFIFINDKGEPEALFAAYAKFPMGKSNYLTMGPEYNSGNVRILLKPQK